MVELFIFLVTAYGASNIMIFGSIFDKWRNLFGVNKDNPPFFGKLFGCMMCLPFWWGVILSIFMYSPTLYTGLMTDITIFNFTLSKEVLSTFFDGCLSSGGVWFIHTVQEKIER